MQQSKTEIGDKDDYARARHSAYARIARLPCVVCLSFTCCDCFALNLCAFDSSKITQRVHYVAAMVRQQLLLCAATLALLQCACAVHPFQYSKKMSDEVYNAVITATDPTVLERIRATLSVFLQVSCVTRI